MSPTVLIAVAALGALSGFLAGLTGSTGTYLALSLLTLTLPDAHLAIGTTLIYSLILCAWGAAAHHRAGRSRPDIALAVGLPAAATAIAGAWLAEQLPSRTLTAGIAIVTATAILAMVIGRNRADTADTQHFTPGRTTYLAAAGGGLALGLLQGTFGVGGGFLLLPFLILALRVPTRLAVAATLFAGIPSLAAAAISHLLLGNVHPAALTALLVGALPLAHLGARTTGRIPPAKVRYVVLGLLSLSCIAMTAAAA